MFYFTNLIKKERGNCMKKIISILLMTALLLTMLSGCSKPEAPSTPEVSDTDSTKKPKFVFVVTGQLGDRSFNDSAANGIKLITEQLGFETNIIEIGRDQTKWEPTFMDLAEGGKYDAIITNGSNAGELIQSIFTEFPDQKFILFDTEIENGQYPNVYAISYKQNEGSYLAGVLAALVTKSDMENSNPEKKIGFIGGEVHPIISDFLVGYIEGAKSVEPDIKVYVSYVGSWDDIAKGKETAIAQYNQGVDIIFPAAEQAGLGCIEAAVEMNKYIIGVDSDQALLFKGVDEAKANVILTSVLKQVDQSLLRAGKLHLEGSLPYGNFESLGIKEGGSGIAINEYYESNVPEDIREEVKKAEEKVTSGEIKVTSALGLENEKIDDIINSVKP